MNKSKITKACMYVCYKSEIFKFYIINNYILTKLDIKLFKTSKNSFIDFKLF